MKMTIGEHAGKSVARLMIEKPDYINWMWRLPNAVGDLALASAHAKTLAARFDAKPYTAGCCGHNCQRVPDRVTIYMGSLTVYPWCDTCNPQQQGADAYKLTEVKTYKELLDYVADRAPSPRGNFKKVVRRMAELKGLTAKKLTEKAVEEWFAG
jgi:hypothetical protein